VTTYQVVFAAIAKRHVHTIAQWWHVNRTKAAGVFQAELSAALAHLAQSPHVGRPYRLLARAMCGASSCRRVATTSTTRSTTRGAS
jgi:plasmid stabilization system protein ParE